jgi:hypothetical protein
MLPSDFAALRTAFPLVAIVSRACGDLGVGDAFCYARQVGERLEVVADITGRTRLLPATCLALRNPVDSASATGKKAPDPWDAYLNRMED